MNVRKRKKKKKCPPVGFEPRISGSRGVLSTTALQQLSLSLWNLFFDKLATSSQHQPFLFYRAAPQHSLHPYTAQGRA